MKKRIIAWIMTFAMVFGSNTFTVFAETMSDQIQLTSDVSPTDLQEIHPTGSNIVTDDDLASTEPGEEATVAPSDLTSETATDDTDHLSDNACKQGYIRLPAGTVVYASVKMKTELGKTDASAIVYAEATSAGDASDVIYKVVFDTENGSSYEGYVRGKELELLSKDEAGSLSGSRQYNGFLIPVILFTFKDNTLTDGLWIYDVVDGYARVLGYQDYKASDLSVPDQLGGYYVNAIGNKAFVKNTTLASLYVHGNVISIADNAFASKDVVLSGYNGTQVLSYAKAHGMKCKNRTAIDGIVLQDHVVDFSYADGSRYEYKGEYSITMNAAEAAQLEKGDFFYIPRNYGKMMRIYAVADISVKDGTAVIEVEEAKAEDSLVKISIQDENLYPDWENATWAEGVEVVEEKVSLTLSPIKDTLKFKWSKPLGTQKFIKKQQDDETNLSLTVDFEGELTLTGKGSLDHTIIPWSFNSFDAEVDIDGQVTAGISAGYNRKEKDKDITKKLTDNKLNLVQKKSYDLMMGVVPLVSGGGQMGFSAGIYLRVGVSGEIKVVSKVHGTLIKMSYTKAKGLERTNDVQWTPLGFSAAVDIDLGIVAKAKLEFVGLGKLISLELFAGFEASAELSGGVELAAEATSSSEGSAGGGYTNGYICFDITVNLKISVKLTTDVDWVAAVVDKSPWKRGWGKSWDLIPEFKWKIKSWHAEYNMTDGWHWVDSCTNSFVNVSFYTGTSEKVKPVKLRSSTVIGADKEPKLTDPIGELEGWYVYKDCTGPTEYASGKGSKVKWDFANDRVNEDITLYAEWRGTDMIPVKFKANFTSNDPAKPVPADIEQNAILGGKLLNPGQLKRNDYRFLGWYTDMLQTTQWDFSSDTVTDDKLTNGTMILYAGWVKEQGYDPNSIEPDNHGRMSFNGHSYTHIADYKSYAEAEADAKRQGGYLATINSQEEQDFLIRYMYDDCAQPYLWLGMTSNDGWKYWRTGEAVTYENWETPPTANADQYNAVIFRDGSSKGKWTTKANTETAHYVIEWGTPATDPNYNKNVKTSDLSYAHNGDGTAKVIGINKNRANQSIDQKFEGDKVTGIAESAFKGNTTLKSISIPEGITEIGASAFEGCTNLKSVVIPSTVTSIGDSVFRGCTSLETVAWSGSMTYVPNHAFDNDTNLKSFYNYSNVTRIGEYAFENCTSLNSFTFPDRLSEIGSYAFYGDVSLREVLIPDSVTTINSSSFRNCEAVYKISIPDDVTYIGSYAFSYCRSASDIYLPKNISSNDIGYSAFYNVNGTFHVWQNSGADDWVKNNGKTYEYLGAKQKIKFSAGETNAYEPSAKDGEMLTELYIDAGNRLTEPVIERDGLTVEGWYLEPEYITKWDFAKNKVPEHSITLYAKWVTSSKVFDYTVSNGTASIKGYSGSMEQVLIPDQINGYTVTAIEEGAFTGTAVREIVIPATVSSIAPGAFDCENLTSIVLRGDRYYSVHDDGVLFNKSGTQLIYAPQGLDFTEYTVPDTVNMIRKGAFRNHEELLKLYTPDGLTSIAANAFEKDYLMTLYGPVSNCTAKKFAAANFIPYNMYVIDYVYDEGVLYSSVYEAGKKIEDYFEPMTDFFSFGGWYKNEERTDEWNFDSDIMPQNDMKLYLKWDTLFDVAVSGDEINITGYRGTAKDIVIPETIGGRRVVGIDSGAFLLSQVKTVQIPDSVVTIQESAFPRNAEIVCSENSAARSYANEYGFAFRDIKYTIRFVTDGGSEVVDMEVVPGNTAVLPVPLKSNYYFYGWFTDTSYMDSVRWTDETVMPSEDVTLYACWRSATTNVTNDFGYKLLEDGTAEITAYSGTKVVLSVPSTINGYTVTRIGNHAFEGNTTVLTVTLPNSVQSIGKNAFANSVVRTVKGASSLNTIEEGAFRDATGLTSIALTTNIRTIGDFAFSGCSGLIEFTLPRGINTVGNKAFYNCEYLESVTVSTTLAELGKDAFKECPRLKSIIVPRAVSSMVQNAFDDGVNVTYKSSTSIRLQSLTITGTSVTAKWNKVTGAASYSVESKLTANETFVRMTETQTTAATLTLGEYGSTYDFKVTALDSNGEVISESISTEIYLSRLNTPAVTSVTQLAESAVKMELKGVDGAEGYEIERAFSPEEDFTLLKSETALSFRNTGLLKGLDYYYRVRAYITENGVRVYSRYSDVYYFHMPYKYVTAPENVRVVQTAVNASTIFWNYVNEADGYIVYRSVNGAAFKQLRQTYNNSTINMSLPEGGTFAYKVCAYFNEGDTQVLGPVSETVTLVLGSVATPIIQSIMQHSATGVSLEWTSVKGASGYKLYMATSEDGPYTWVKNLGNVTASTMASKMSAGNTYYFKIRAFVNNLDSTVDYSDYSLPVSIDFSSVPKITGLTAVQNGSNKAKLTWTAISEIEKYEVWVSAVNDQNYELVTTTTARTATIENLNDGVDYFFKVRGCNGEGNSKVTGEYSDAVSVSILGAPELQVAEQCGTTSVQLIWSKVGSADGYEIWRKTSSEDYKLAKTVEVNSAQVFGLEVGSTYGFKVRPYKLDESGSKQYGYYSNVISVYIIGTTKISSLVRNGGSSVQLTWSKATGATGYALYRSDSINGVFKKVKTTTALSISNSGLTKGEAYYFRIVPYRTVNGVDIEGRPTAVKGIRMLDKPVITSVEQTASKTLTLTWTEVPMAAFYRIYRSEGQNGEFTLLKKVTDSTTATSVNLTQDKWYYYTVEAGIDEDNTTYYSLQSNASGSYVTSMEKTEISTSVQTSPTSVTVSWKKVSGASGYELLRSSSEDGEYTSLKILTATSFTDKELTQGQTYYYKVRPYKVVSGISVFGMKSNAAGIRMLGAVNLTALERTASKRVDLYWEPVANASSYMIFRSDSKDGTYAFLKGTTDTTAYNTALTLGATYYYKVAAVISDGTVTNIGPQSSALGITLYDIGSTSVTSVKQTKSATVELEWKAVSNVEGYELSMASEGNTVFSKVKNSVSTKTSTTLNLTDNRTFRYRVRAYITVDGKKEYGPYSQPVSITLMSAPALNALYQTASNSVQMTWTEASSVDGYEVYRKEANGSFAKIKTVTELSVDNKALTIETKYTYKIRAYRTLDGITSYSGYSNEMSITPIRYTKGNYPESAHDYSNNMNQSWTYSIDGAKALRVKFVAETNFENSYDKLYITDKDGNSVGNSYWTGTQLSSKTLIVPGNTINLRMTTDGSVVRYGFAIESITPAGQ